MIRSITREVSYTLSRSFIDIGDNVHTCLGGGGGGGGVGVIGFGDVGLFWCWFGSFLGYICVLFLCCYFSMLSHVLSYKCLV